ncbi:hypothetical protein [Robertkochia aurantiaca]|uniref:hypothetical protein n=1 Tax=Robertkochia aurantiaca TaxID=2873700 RepID=UPI001CCB1E4F|nr:hypothetical protein [Robertkochia sp. 3YJGBD-33]
MYNYKRTATSVILVTFLLFIVGASAQRGYEYENFGNRSVLLNGNVTGSVDDLGAVYYNPARLALIENPGFLIQGKLYEWNNLTIENLVPEQRFTSSNFNGLPGMLAGSIDILGTTFYYSSISRNRVDLSLNYNSGLLKTEAQEILPEDNQESLSLSLNNKLREDWFGLTWAYPISENVAIGFSLFASSYRYSGGDALRLVRQNQDNQVSVYESNMNFSQRSYGIYGKVGAAWILPGWELGINLDLPYLEIYEKSSFYFDEVLSNTEGEDRIIIDDLADLSSRHKTPLSINIGAGIPWKRHKFHLNASWYAPVEIYDRIDIPVLGSETGNNAVLLFREKRRTVINFGTGAEIFFNEETSGFLSFSTDFSPLREADELLGDQSGIGISNAIAFDNYHFGGGMNFRFNNLDVVLGLVHSVGRQIFEPARDVPFLSNLLPQNSFTIKNARWRFLLGLNISLGELFKITPEKEQ